MGKEVGQVVDPEEMAGFLNGNEHLVSECKNAFFGLREKYKPTSLVFRNDRTGVELSSTLNPLDPIPDSLKNELFNPPELHQDFHVLHPIFAQLYNVCGTAREFEMHDVRHGIAYATTLMLHIHDALHTVSLSSARTFADSFIKGAFEAIRRRQIHENVDPISVLRLQSRMSREKSVACKLPVEKFRAVILFAARCTFFKGADITTLIIVADELGKYLVRNLEIFEFRAVRAFVECLDKFNGELMTEREEKMMRLCWENWIREVLRNSDEDVQP